MVVIVRVLRTDMWHKNPALWCVQKATAEGAKAKAGGGAAAAAAAAAPEEQEEPEEEEAGAESGEDNASDEEQDMSGGDGATEEKTEKKKKEDEEEEDEDWDTFKMESKKENSLETKKKESHSVHCPFFPAVSC